MATNAKGRVIKIIVTDKTKTDCKAAFTLTKNIKIDILIADRTYDIDDIIEYVKNNGIEIVIHPKSNRKLKIHPDDSLYPCRHTIENTFLAFKRWYSIVTCYSKTSIAFIFSLLISSIFISIFSRFLLDFEFVYTI